jgi:peptide/nickel transport system permease protein
MTMMTEPGDAGSTLFDTALPAGRIEGRSLGRIAWTRFKRDKIAIAAGVVIILLILMAVFAGPLSGLSHNNPDAINTNLIDPNLQVPTGGMGGISTQHWLGVDLLGRDLFSRIVYGARYSLGIACASTVLAILIGVLAGMAAGYFGGFIDALISRTMDVMLAFPVLLFAISISGVLQNGAFGLTGTWLHIWILVFIIGFFSWPYIGRIIRGQVIGIREREYIEASRSLGATPSRILFREILPNLVAPILVYSTLLIPANILFEAALSFLGVGLKEPTPSWGAMINTAIPYDVQDPEYFIVPGLAIFLTVLAFNLFGDGLRDALDPKGSR